MRYVLRLVARGLGLLGLLLAAALPALAQAPTWLAAAGVGTQPGSSYSMARATAPDGAGGVYVAGYFTGTLTVGGTTLTSAGGEDIFVAKYLPATGTWVWAQRAGGPTDDQATALAVVGTAVYVAGTFTGTAAFGGLARTSAGATDAFVAKLLDAGPTAAVQWVQAAGGPNHDQTQALAATLTGVYWLGGFLASAQLGPVALTSPTVLSSFLACLTDGGAGSTVAWAQVLPGVSPNWSAALTVQDADLYLAGVFSTSLTLGTVTVPGTGNFNLFVAKLLDTGTGATCQWATASTNTGTATPLGLTVGPAGIYVVGNFFNTIGLGGTTLASASTALGAGDIFVAKLQDAGTSGTFRWAQRAGGLANDFATAVAVRGSQVYVAGTFSGAASFGPLVLTSLGPNDDIFVAKLLDAGGSGTWAWAERAGGAGNDLATSLALAGTGPLYVAGTLVPPATFGTLPVGPAAADFRGFVAALAESPGLATGGAAPALALAVYPSPTHGPATVRLPAGLAAGEATLTLLDALGRAVRTRTVALAAGSSQAEFDAGGLAPGVYALRVAVGERRGTARLVVE